MRIELDFLSKEKINRLLLGQKDARGICFKQKDGLITKKGTIWQI
jgi:hypothetical protein